MDKYHYTFLMPFASFGGLEMQMVRRAADAVQKGENALFISCPDSRPEKYALSLNVPVERLDIRVDYVDVIAAYRLGQMMKKAGSKVCVVSATKHLSIAILARNLLLPELAVIFYQQLHGSRKKKDPFHNWVYRNVDGAVAITRKLKQSLVTRTCFPAERVEIIPPGVDLDSFDPLKHDKKSNRRRFNLPEEALLIGLVGRIEPSKGQDVALRAFAKAGISNAALVLCGAPHTRDYLESLMTLSKELGIRESVHVLPFTYEIPVLMNAFDFSLLPSRGETFGLVVVEAMASGIPIIATNAEGVPEIVAHEKNGLLFDPGDDETLAKYMKVLADNETVRRRLGGQARRDACERYDYKAQRDKFFDFCKRIHRNRLRGLHGA